jgi:elongation factor G
MPDAALQPFVDAINSTLGIGVTGFEAFTVQSYRASLSGIVDLMQQTYAQNLPGALLSGAVLSGVLAGYQVVDVKATVYFGSYHEVDSNEFAFITCAMQCFKQAFLKAKPQLLEPMMDVEVAVPETYMGAANGSINQRRGRVEGMAAASGQGAQGMTTIEATIPYAEVTDYATRLRSLSRGTGEFELEMSGYEQVPHDVQQRLAAEYQERRAAGER